MLPELWTVPLINYPIKSYGLMLMVGFLSAVYLAARRAEKVKADPDIVINIGFFALVGGVCGARLFYVIHYWERYFSGRTNPLLAIIDVTQGGMEFLGGVVGAFVLIIPYVIYKRASIRLYLDILTPGLMWGLAFGRLGCFLNGCCWGGICEGSVAEKWAVSFPFGSPAYVRQFQQRQVEVPAPLLSIAETGEALPLDRRAVKLQPKDLNKTTRALAESQEMYERLTRIDPEAPETAQTKKKVERLKRVAMREQAAGLIQMGPCEFVPVASMQRNLRSYPSQEFPGQSMTPSELTDLAAQHRSRQVHPAQLYASINALLASCFLAWLFRIRQRHGVVFAVFLMTYPLTRICLELIRVDNPKDAFGLTISQFAGLLMIAVGLLTYVILRQMPLHSRLAVPWEPPPEGEAAAALSQAAPAALAEPSADDPTP